MGQQYRATFYTLNDARSSYKPAIFMDSGCLMEVALEMHGEGAQSLFDE